MHNKYIICYEYINLCCDSMVTCRVKQGCPLWLTIFGLCISLLKDRYAGLDKLYISHDKYLLYGAFLVFSQHLVCVVDDFCNISGPLVNVGNKSHDSKTLSMV